MRRAVCVRWAGQWGPAIVPGGLAHGYLPILFSLLGHSWITSGADVQECRRCPMCPSPRAVGGHHTTTLLIHYPCCQHEHSHPCCQSHTRIRRLACCCCCRSCCSCGGPATGTCRAERPATLLPWPHSMSGQSSPGGSQRYGCSPRPPAPVEHPHAHVIVGCTSCCCHASPSADHLGVAPEGAALRQAFNSAAALVQLRSFRQAAERRGLQLPEAKLLARLRQWESDRLRRWKAAFPAVGAGAAQM